MGCCFDSEGEREQLIVNDSGPTYVPILNQYEFEGADENSSKKLSQELSRRSSTMSSTQESPNQQRKSFERKVVEQEQTESDFAKAIRSPSKEQVIGTTSSMNLNKHNSLATLLNSSKTLPSYSNSAVGVSLSQSFVDNSFPILNTFGNSLRLDYIVTQAQQEFLNIEHTEATSRDSIEDRQSTYQNVLLDPSYQWHDKSAPNYDIIARQKYKMTSTSESVELQLNQSDVALINEVKESVFKNFEAMHIVPNDGPMFVDLLEGVTL